MVDCGACPQGALIVRSRQTDVQAQDKHDPKSKNFVADFPSCKNNELQAA
jgi:hypothetical protein